MFLQITSHNDGNVTIIDTNGDLALGCGIEALQEVIHDLHTSGRALLVLNLSGVTSLGASSVDPLISARQRLASGGGDMKIAGIRLSANNILAVARLYSVFEIFENEASAVRSFREGTRLHGSDSAPARRTLHPSCG